MFTLIGATSYFIDIKIHHGGQFVTTPILEYKGGEITMWYRVDVDMMLFIKLVKEAQKMN